MRMAGKGIISCRIDECGKLRDRFNTPGHKGALCLRDVTESGVNEEIFPSDCIQRAQDATARIYGVDRIRYLTGGSSMGIKAALWQFRGQKVLYAAGAHRAFAEGCELAGVRAVKINSGADGAEYTKSCAVLPPPVTVEQVECAVKTHRDAKAVFLTSPDCFGRTADIEISRLCRGYGVALIADSAHGAHFAFAEGLEKYRFETTADFCNMSAHKTLGAYTQSALLAVNRAYESGVDAALKLLGTTSPNYALMERLELSVEEACENRDGYGRLKDFSDKLRGTVNCMQNTDYTRIVWLPERDAVKAYGELISGGIAPEAVIGDSIVFILTPYDDDEKLQRLYDALTGKRRAV